MTTKTAFLDEYRRQLPKLHPWANDAERLDRFMVVVESDMMMGRNTWNWDSPTSRASWRAIGCPGRMTFKGLCALPSGVSA